MLQQLQIFGCDEDGNQDDTKSFTLQVNPSEIKIDHANQYSSSNAMGTIGSDQKFNKTEPASLFFKSIIDGTGAIKASTLDVQETITQIKDICYSYHGENHEPNKNIIIWGNIFFKGCLSKLNVSYKLFSPEGKILRAELEMTFEEYKSNKEECKQKNQQSPDITHIKQFKAGDSLPVLCHKVYKNAKLFVEIARVNCLTDFRNIPAGTKIVFPPLK